MSSSSSRKSPSAILVSLCIFFALVSLFWILFRPPTKLTIESDSFVPSQEISVSWVTSSEYYAKRVLSLEPSYSQKDSLTSSTKADSKAASFFLPPKLIHSLELQTSLPENTNPKAKVCTSTTIFGTSCSEFKLQGESVDCVDTSCTMKTEFTISSLSQIDLIFANILLALSTVALVLTLTKNVRYLPSLSNKIRQSKLYRWMDRVGAPFSEDHLIKFDGNVVAIILISIVVFLISTILGIHTSSIYQWNTYLGPSHRQDGLLVGRPLSIRSDEWLVRTPSVYSQSYQDYPTENQNIGSEKAPMAMNTPTDHISTILRPQMWGYFLAGPEKGFIFEWDIGMIGLFLGSFLCLMILTRSNLWLSLGGALWLFFASYTQWWFSSVAGILSAFFFMTASGFYLLTSRHKRSILISGILLLISGLNFVLTLYPPYLIPLTYIFAALMIGAVVQYRSYVFDKNLILYRICTLLAGGIIGIGILLLFLTDIRSTIEVITNTSYPGDRTSTGGVLSITRVFSGYFTFLMRESSFPNAFGNASESSNFILLLPLTMPVLLFSTLKRNLKIQPIHISLIILLILFLLWMIVPFPQFLGDILLLNRVFENRMLLSFGIVDLFLFCSLLSVLYKNKKTSWQIHLGTGLFAFILTLTFGLLLHSQTSFLSFPVIISISALIAIFAAALTAQRYTVAGLIGLALIAPTMALNPISHDVNVFEDSSFKNLVSEYSDGQWITYGDSAYANLLKAYGGDVFNGVKYTPQLDKISLLDPEMSYYEIYNRYAHITVEEPTDQTPLFELIYPDSYILYLDPCDSRLHELGIKYVFFSYKPDHISCADEIFSRIDEDISLWAYEITPP